MSLTLDELRERVKKIDKALAHTPGVEMSAIAYRRFYNDHKQARLALRELIAELREINERSGIEMAFAALLAELEDDDVDA